MLDKIKKNLEAGHRYYNRDNECYMNDALSIYEAIVIKGEWVDDIDAPIVHHKPITLKW